MLLARLLKTPPLHSSTSLALHNYITAAHSTMASKLDGRAARIGSCCTSRQMHAQNNLAMSAAICWMCCAGSYPNRGSCIGSSDLAFLACHRSGLLVWSLLDYHEQTRSSFSPLYIHVTCSLALSLALQLHLSSIAYFHSDYIFIAHQETVAFRRTGVGNGPELWRALFEFS